MNNMDAISALSPANSPKIFAGQYHANYVVDTNFLASQKHTFITRSRGSCQLGSSGIISSYNSSINNIILGGTGPETIRYSSTNLISQADPDTLLRKTYNNSNNSRQHSHLMKRRSSYGFEETSREKRLVLNTLNPIDEAVGRSMKRAFKLKTTFMARNVMKVRQTETETEQPPPMPIVTIPKTK